MALRFSWLLFGVLPLGCAGPSRAPAGGAAFVNYRCASGRGVDASFSAEHALLRYAGRTHRMTVARSGSGARYVGDGLVWWTKGRGPGSEGTLFREEPGSASGAVLESCTWASGEPKGAS